MNPSNTKEQRVTEPDNILTHLDEGLEESKDNRQFAKVISLPDSAPLWDEWTPEQYQAWKEIYDPDPQPEVQDAEKINPVKEVRTSNPLDYIEITQAELDAYEVQWQVAHEPVTVEEPNEEQVTE